jgi:phosphohistidine phosphatase
MNVYFLRHGVAVEPGEWNGRDFDRPLTPGGIARMKREAKTIAGLSLDLDAVVTSPLLRARQTAQIVAERLGLSERLVEDQRLGGEFDLVALAAILAAHAGARAVLLVGHEPTFSATVGRLVGGASVEVKKGALAGVALAGADSTRGTLICLIPPRVLGARGKGRNQS